MSKQHKCQRAVDHRARNNIAEKNMESVRTQCRSETRMMQHHVSYLHRVGDLPAGFRHDLLHPYRHVEAVVEVGGLLEEPLSGPEGGGRSCDVRNPVPLVGKHPGVALLLRDYLIFHAEKRCNSRKK